MDLRSIPLRVKEANTSSHATKKAEQSDQRNENLTLLYWRINEKITANINIRVIQDRARNLLSMLRFAPVMRVTLLARIHSQSHVYPYGCNPNSYSTKILTKSGSILQSHGEDISRVPNMVLMNLLFKDPHLKSKK